jgi:hypothetical protein
MRTELKPRTKSLKIILDSNAFFVPLQFKIDIVEELKTLLNMRHELVLLSPVKQELERLVNEGSPQTRKNAVYALKLAEKCELVNAEDDETPVDDVIMEAARKGDCAVFTNDKQLRKKLRDINVPVIYVRQKSRLNLDGRL